jgi:hypothetical protein
MKSRITIVVWLFVIVGTAATNSWVWDQTRKLRVQRWSDLASQRYDELIERLGGWQALHDKCGDREPRTFDCWHFFDVYKDESKRFKRWP